MLQQPNWTIHPELQNEPIALMPCSIFTMHANHPITQEISKGKQSSRRAVSISGVQAQNPVQMATMMMKLQGSNIHMHTNKLDAVMPRPLHGPKLCSDQSHILSITDDELQGSNSIVSREV